MIPVELFEAISEFPIAILSALPDWNNPAEIIAASAKVASCVVSLSEVFPIDVMIQAAGFYLSVWIPLAMLQMVVKLWKLIPLA